MLSRRIFPWSVVSSSGKCYTCETEPAVCQLLNHVESRMEVGRRVSAKQMAATNVIQLPGETNAQNVSRVLESEHSHMIQWTKTKERRKKKTHTCFPAPFVLFLWAGNSLR